MQGVQCPGIIQASYAVRDATLEVVDTGWYTGGSTHTPLPTNHADLTPGRHQTAASTTNFREQGNLEGKKLLLLTTNRKLVELV